MEPERKVDTAKWKSELNSNGYILCDRDACGMGFLSVRGFEAHFRSCNGHTPDGGFVTCTGCPVRFKTFQIMERHREKSHASIAKIKAEPSKSVMPARESDVPGLFSDNLERVETQEDLRLRILAESRQISTPRPVGRPPRKVEQHNFPRAPVVQRRRDSSSSYMASNSSIDLETIKNENVRLGIVEKEKQLAEQEKQLREYQERVLRYERLAEDAARVALQEKELRLKKLASDLRQRELEAKDKLAKAVKSMEMAKKQSTSDSASELPQLVELVKDDEVIGEDHCINTILPDIPDKSPETAGNVDVTIIAANDDAEEMILVDNNGSLESLLAKAQRGEVTLVTQAKDDGTFVLVENEQELVNEDLQKSQAEPSEPNEIVGKKIETKIVNDEPQDMIIDIKDTKEPNAVENLSEALESQKQKGVRKRKSRGAATIESVPQKSSDPPIAKRLRTSSSVQSAERNADSKKTRTRSKSQNKDEKKQIEKPQSVVSERGQMSFACGKCPQGFKTLREFDIHAASAHGCAARPKGQDQTMSDVEILSKIQHCFKMKYAKKITCFRCQNKTFQTFGGIKYHWMTCGKSKEELDSLMESCPHCDYKGLASNLKQHIQNHATAEEPEDKSEVMDFEDLQTTLTSTGRQSRKAASRASKRMSQVFQNQTDAIEDDEDDDDEFQIDAKADFKKQKDGTLLCLQCQRKCQSKEDFEKHYLSEHAEDVNEEDEDDLESDDGSSIASGADEYDDIAPESSPRVKSKGGRRSSYSTGVDQTIVAAEKKYRADNYDFNAFERIAIEAWQPLKINDETCTSSVKFKMGKESFQKACRQGALHDQDKLSFYAGGPITASDWCPAQFNQSEIIAVASKDYIGASANVQLWTFESKNPTQAPLLSLSFEIENVTGINALKWCPSLKASGEEDQRLGLLSAGCNDCSVKIFAIDRSLLSSQQRAFVARPSLILKRHESKSQCLKIDWYKGKGHRVVAAAFDDGSVCLWDLCTQSRFLTVDANCLLPIRSIKCHLPCNKLGIALSTDNAVQWPKYLISGSTDRQLCLWNLNHPKGPVLHAQTSSFVVNDIAWLNHYENRNFYVAFDDNTNPTQNRTMIFDTAELGERGIGATMHNSAVHSIDYSPWLNVFMSGSTAGEVLLFIGDEKRTFRKLQLMKQLSSKRALLYSSSISGKEEGSDKDLEYLPSYAQLLSDQDFSVDFTDKNNCLLKLSSEEVSMLKDKDKLPYEDVRKYPLLSVNRVHFSPNLHSRNWIFTGSASGLGRLLAVSSLK